MTSDDAISLVPIGRVVSAIVDPADAPRQGDEAPDDATENATHDATDEPMNRGACEAWVEVRHELAAGLSGVAVGDELVVVTWLHLADRDVLEVHPRGDEARPLTGVFATRSPHRPNPLGLHRVTVLERTDTTLRVAGLEAVDGTPVVDLKPVLHPIDER